MGTRVVEAEGDNWLGALGEALGSLGVDTGVVGRLVVSLGDDGSISARDPRTGIFIHMEPVREASGPAAIQLPPPSFGFVEPAYPEQVEPTFDMSDLPGAAPEPEPAAQAPLSDRLEMLFMACGDIAMAGSVRGACSEAVRVLTESVPADAGAALVRCPGGLKFEAASGPASKGLVGTVIPGDQGIAGFVLGFAMGICVDDAQRDTRHYKRVDKATGYRTKGIMAVPVLGRAGAALGVLELLNPPSPFTADDIEVGRTIAQALGEVLDGAGV
jgi:GAF domain-containing protein